MMAHRYLYYVKQAPIISDTTYDQIEKEILKEVQTNRLDGKKSPLATPGSDDPKCYPKHVRYLATALLAKHLLKTKPKNEKPKRS